jgi:hypothetical protein
MNRWWLRSSPTNPLPPNPGSREGSESQGPAARHAAEALASGRTRRPSQLANLEPV